jgi:RNA polymerase sigma factor (sigma-70 family)
MRDRAFVAAMVASDPRGLEGAYRAYAPPLQAYCRGLLGSSDAAADAVHDTFVLASQRISQLRDPDKLRAWLYAIARNECMRHLHGRARQVPLEEAGEVSAPTTDPGAGVHAAQVKELVWAAAEALNAGDRELFELMVRHDLAPAEIGAVLGISADHAHARASRARGQLERALGALLVARAGPGACASLADVLRGWSGTLNPLLRKRITRHVDGCTVCRARLDDELRPAAMLAAYQLLPFAIVVPQPWGRIQASVGSAGTTAHSGSSQARAGEAGPIGLTGGEPVGRRPVGRSQISRGPVQQLDKSTGFPRQRITQRRRGTLLVAVAILVIVTGFCGAYVWAGNSPAVTAQPSPDRTAKGPPGSAGPSLVAPTVSPRTSVSLTGSPPTTTTSPALTLTVSGARFPDSCPSWHLSVTAKISVGAISSATLHYRRSSSAPLTRPMTVSGDHATVTVSSLVDNTVTWWVVVQTVDGHGLTSQQKVATRPCA